MVYYTLTQIVVKILEALFCGQWYKQLLMIREISIFLDVNPSFFPAMVGSSNKKKIPYPDSTLGKSCVGNYDFNYLWQLLFSFGLEYNGVVDAKEST